MKKVTLIVFLHAIFITVFQQIVTEVDQEASSVSSPEWTMLYGVPSGESPSLPSAGEEGPSTLGGQRTALSCSSGDVLVPTGFRPRKGGFFQRGSKTPPLPADPGGCLQPPLPLAGLHPTEQGQQWGRPAWVISSQTSGNRLPQLKRAPPTVQDLQLRTHTTRLPTLPYSSHAAPRPWSLHQQFSSVQSLSRVSTLCNPMDCSTPGLPVHHWLLELAQTHVHEVGDAIQPSHPLSSPSPPALNLSQHQGLFK